MNKELFIIKNIKLIEYLGDRTCCPGCNSNNTFIMEASNHLYCNDCNKMCDFFATLIHNLKFENHEKCIEEFYKYAKLNEEKRNFIKNAASSDMKNCASISDLQEALLLQPNKSILLLKAPTGTGKTYNICLHVSKMQEKVVIIVPTRNEVYRYIKILKNLGVLDNEIDPVISGFDNSSDELTTHKKTFKRIIVTTYAYLELRGHSGEIYSISEAILKDRIIFCDEIQSIETYSNKTIPVSARYYADGSSLKLSDKCLKSIRKGDCSKCFRIENNEVGKNKDIIYYSRHPISNYPGIETRKYDNPLYKPEFYTDAGLKNVLTRKIKKVSELDKHLADFPFIKESLGSYEKIEARIQFPYMKNEEGKLVHIAEIPENCEDKIIYPKYACGIPTLHLKSMTICEQMFYHGTKIVAMSATIPNEIENDFIQTAEKYGFSFNKIEITDTPYRFNVKILKLEEHFGYEAKIDILKSIDTEKFPVFLVETTKRTLANLHGSMKKFPELNKQTTTFNSGSYESAYDSHIGIHTEKDAQNNIILTYAGSSICKAFDMPYINLVIVDCSMFLPTIALNFDEGTSELKQRELQAKNIYEKLTQIIGRVFRSNNERIPGQTVLDERPIVILLYNLPVELQDFEPDKNLVYDYQEFKDDYIKGIIPSKVAESVIKSLNEALNGLEITDKGKLQKDLIIQKAIEVGLSKLNKRTEREILTDEDLEYIKIQRSLYKQNLKSDENPNNE